MRDCGIILLTFTIALAATGWLRRLLVRRNLLDRPNERSSHQQPVPRGGGWALLLVLLPGMVVAGIIQHNLIPHLGLIAGTLLLAAVSWADDRHEVRAAIRLACHLVAALLGSFCFAPDQTLFGGALPFILDRAVLILGWAWFMNLYNFMDGIDGITGVETVALAAGSCLALTVSGIPYPFAGTLALLLTGACLGFLTYNWHPAKIFLGDVGSVPLGYLTGFLLAMLALNGHPVAALILPLYYLADSGITIGRRAWRREKVWQAHRQHFYQRAALVAGRHDRVVLWIAGADILLIIAAMTAIDRPLESLALAATVVALLLLKMHKAA